MSHSDKFNDPNLKIYLDVLKKNEPLCTEDQLMLFEKIKDNRNRIVEANLRLVVKIAFEVYEGWKMVDVMDLIQEGNIALIKSVEKYELGKGYAFSTFATYRIKGSMIDYIRNNTGQLRTGTTKAQRAIFNNIGEIKKELEESGATLVEVGDKFGFDPADYGIMTAQTEPIDAVNIAECGTSDSVEDVYLMSEARLNLRKKILAFRDSLDFNEKFIWDTRLMEQQFTLKECQEPLKMTHTEQVRRLEAKVIEKAKDYFDIQDFYDIVGKG